MDTFFNIPPDAFFDMPPGKPTYFLQINEGVVLSFRQEMLLLGPKQTQTVMPGITFRLECWIDLGGLRLPFEMQPVILNAGAFWDN